MVVELQRFAERAEAEQHALVLVAVGIGSHLAADAGGFALFVADADAARARRELAAWRRENRPRPASDPHAFPPGIEAALGAIAILVFLHGAALQDAFGIDWRLAGRAQSDLILGGEPWRALTALGLHADWLHLLGNVGLGAIFAAALSQRLGAGLAWAAILLAGAAGNVLNAAASPAGHLGIGASTAVFGALGLLVAFLVRDQASIWRGGIRRWAPIGTAVMVFAFLGVGGERTDWGAHLAGLTAGLAIGGAMALLGGRLARGPRAQRLFGAAALAAFAAAWWLALAA